MAEGSAFDFGKQVGPLPVGGWVAAVVGGVGIAYYMHRKNAATTATAAAAPAPTTTGTPSTPGAFGSGLQTGGVLALPQNFVPIGQLSQQPAPTQQFQTNDQWRQAVTTDLIATGDDPILVDRALADYLDGHQLDYQESQVIEIALKRDGPPPNPPATVAPAPPPTSSPAPAAPPGIDPLGGNTPDSVAAQYNAYQAQLAAMGGHDFLSLTQLAHETGHPYIANDVNGPGTFIVDPSAPTGAIRLSTLQSLPVPVQQALEMGWTPAWNWARANGIF